GLFKGVEVEIDGKILEGNEYEIFKQILSIADPTFRLHDDDNFTDSDSTEEDESSFPRVFPVSEKIRIYKFNCRNSKLRLAASKKLESLKVRIFYSSLDNKEIYK